VQRLYKECRSRETFQCFRERKLRRKSAFAHRGIATRSAGSQENLSRFHKSRNLRRDNVFKNVDGSQRYRFRRGNKGQDLWNLENLLRKMKKLKDQEGATVAVRSGCMD
jgi:hypothetical protein